ncbi:MAG: hypothetical protein HQK84_04740, partial [Nitrospinae bacterium]|nr:hypothetical protein [Nitrospinota bacterium]
MTKDSSTNDENGFFPLDEEEEKQKGKSRTDKDPEELFPLDDDEETSEADSSDDDYPLPFDDTPETLPEYSPLEETSTVTGSETNNSLDEEDDYPLDFHDDDNDEKASDFFPLDEEEEGKKDKPEAKELFPLDDDEEQDTDDDY